MSSPPYISSRVTRPHTDCVLYVVSPAVSPAPDHSPALAAVKAIVRNTD